MNKKRIIFGILSLMVMIGIFMFSAKNAAESTEESLEVGMKIGKLTVKDFDELPKKEQLSFAKKIDHAVRKSAHFLEYTLLGIMLTGFYTALEKKKMAKMLFFAWLTGAVYSVTDELHQLFVPGRSCQIFDVMIDSSGVLTGTIVMAAVIFIVCLIQSMRRKTVKL